MKRFFYLVTLSLAVFALAIFPDLTTLMPVKAKPILLSQKVNFPPPDVTAPDNRQKPSYAGPCRNESSIIPLMPPSNIGLTVSESPTLFAYVSLAFLTKVDFIVLLTDKEPNKLEEIVYETELKVDKPGIIAITIPATADNKQLIEVGKRYRWGFSLACNPEQNMEGYGSHTAFTGYIERIEAQPSLKNELANPDPMVRAIAYAKNGIWYETVATLAEMRRKAPDDATLAAEWRNLLQSQKLGDIVDKPLVQSF
jgi:Domain of Unknown Function (DUF928)